MGELGGMPKQYFNTTSSQSWWGEGSGCKGGDNLNIEKIQMRVVNERANISARVWIKIVQGRYKPCLHTTTSEF